MDSRTEKLEQLKRAVAAIERGDGPSSFPAGEQGADGPPPASLGRFGSSPEPSPPAARAQRASRRKGSAEALEGEAGKDLTAQAAYQKILRVVSVRERSTAYLRERLLKDEFPPDTVEEALQKACRLHIVDDRRYGDALIRMRLAAGKGLREAEREIEALGVDPTTLDAWQEHDALGRDAEVERAVALLRRRPPRAKQAREAAFRKLVGQGFATDVASTAARRWFEEL